MENLPDWYNPDFDPYCLEIGRLTALWAGFERVLDELLWEALDVHAYMGACLTAQMIGPGPRGRALASLVGVMGGDKALVDTAKDLTAKAEKLGAKRNRYIHDPVFLTQETKKFLREEITAHKDLRFNRESVDIVKIRNLSVEIKELSESFREFRVLMIRNLPLWQRKRYEKSVAGRSQKIPHPEQP